ncbi:MAG: glycosyltransferase [Myxococcales bacterium]|nr:glycosyltransferase [Myxococcales bacterium]
MRTWVVTTSYPSSEGDPAGHFVREEARILAREARVTVLAPAPSRGHAGAPSDDGVEVRWQAGGGAFGWPGASARLRARPSRALGAAGFVARAIAALRRERPERVVAHWALPCAAPIALAAGRGAELFVVSHGGDARALARLPLRDAVARAIAGRASEWRFVSAPLAEGLLASLAPSAARAVERVLRIAPCAVRVDEPPAEAVARARTSMQDTPFFCVVGRLVATKRVDAGLRWVAERHPGAPVVVVGDGPERARLERAAARAGVRTKFVGAVERPEALAWMRASRGLVFASIAEGAPTVIREAHALGVPVVGPAA